MTFLQGMENELISMLTPSGNLRMKGTQPKRETIPAAENLFVQRHVLGVTTSMFFPTMIEI